MLQQDFGEGTHRCQNTFFPELADLEDVQEKNIEETEGGGEGNTSNKITQGKGVHMHMLNAELITSTFSWLSAEVKHLRERAAWQQDPACSL